MEGQPTQLNNVEPIILEKIQGQPQVISLLSIHLAAYWNDRQAGKTPSFGPVGLFGPPGVGKTLTARAVHFELGNLKFIEIISESLDHKDSLYSTLMEVDENTTLFIDEAQGLPKQAQHILLKVLAEGKLCIPKGRFAKKNYQIPLPNFVTILASTHESGVAVETADLRSPDVLFCGRLGQYRSSASGGLELESRNA